MKVDWKTTKSGQNLNPFYRECRLYGVSVLERFHCIIRRILTPGKIRIAAKNDSYK